MQRPTIHVVEYNPYTPQPFVMSEVAVCLRDAIRAAGYPSGHLVNRIDPSAYCIVLNVFPGREAELPGLDPVRCAIFNLEQLGSGSTLAGPGYRKWLANWLVLDYHAWNVALLRQENGTAQEVIELPLVPSRSLVTPAAQPKTVDVLFYGTMSNRRRAVLDELQALGLRTEVVAGAYGHELAPAIHRARLVLHVHFYEQGLFPIARILQPVAVGVPVVCETSVFSELNDWSRSGILFTDDADLAKACAALLADTDEMERRAQATRAFAAGIDFATPFERAVRAFERRAAAPPPSPPPPAPEVDGPLADEHIEAILAREAAAAAPPDDSPGDVPGPVQIVRREPGQGRFGIWAVLVLLAFMLLGSINLVMSYRH